MERILVVDDTDSARFLVRGILSSAGYEVLECKDGQAAIAACLSDPPELIILDLMMPGVDGLQVCRELRSRYSEIELPIVVVTAKDESEALPEVLKAGANDYLSKPISKEVLLARVRNQIATSHARRETQELVEIQSAIVEALPQALAIASAEGQILHANRSWKAVVGAPQVKKLSESFDLLYAGNFAKALQELLALVQLDPEIELDRELSSSAGDVRHIHLVSRPIHTEPGKILRLWLSRDLTRTRELERRVNERMRLESVGMLVRGVAHNFNNVLGGVLGAAEILERYVEQGERPRRALRIIRQGSESAAALTRKLSIFSGVGRAEDDLNMGELHEVLDAIILMHQSQVGDRVSLSLEVPTDLPQLGISLDKFVEVLNHLLLNAIEAIPDSGNIVVAAKLSAAKDSVAVSIKDSGVGMSPETVQRVFEPFFTTKNLDTRNAIGIEGHGLGLWNVYNLIHACGGEISVQSKVGEGTNVSVLIPVIAGS